MKTSIFHRILARLMRQADVAIVMTDYNRIDPVSLGIGKIEMIPYQLPGRIQQVRAVFVQRESSAFCMSAIFARTRGHLTC